MTDRVLRRSGWSPGRSVPTAPWESALCDEGGFVFHAAARDFLAEFGGLTVVRGSDHGRGWREFQLDPLLAKDDREIFEALDEEAGTPLCPLGMADHRNFYLGMASSGAVYVGMDYIDLLAETADDALERLIRGSGAGEG
ncbi:SUKH-3 domain-containing protein [Streptomyces sp. WAC 01529]|uniref:SUKH-3 domain-containing protein n=1 Tax=Streptomyces sp. WAC 01529 TaxID=2203205 RepID=UPI0013DF0728|nr:SUKH-3 domain-containing protein [Streptomyces sp. WAC 01529]